MEDQRIRITRSMLKNALHALLQEKSIEKISVYELCKRATINRTTFYKYYGSQYDVLDEMQEDFSRDFEAHMQLADESLDLTKKLLDYVWGHKDLCITIINAVPNEALVEKLFSRPIIEQLINSRLSTRYTKRQQPYVLNYYYHGSFHIMYKWLTEEHPLSIEEVHELMISLSKVTLFD